MLRNSNPSSIVTIPDFKLIVPELETCKVIVFKLDTLGVINPKSNARFPKLLVYAVPVPNVTKVKPVLVDGEGPNAGCAFVKSKKVYRVGLNLSSGVTSTRPLISLVIRSLQYA